MLEHPYILSTYLYKFIRKNLNIWTISRKLFIDSSETIRKISDKNFNDYLKIKPSHIKDINSNFLWWFIGFSEGDGSFSISKNRNIFQITQKDPKVLYFIKKKLGFGIINKRKDNYYVYTVSDINNIIKLIYIFNGNLQLNKTNIRFKKWFENKNYNHISIKLSNKNIISLNNAWLSGFIDAEGCFYCLLINNKRIKLRFIIDQKNESMILQNIINIFEFKDKKIYNRNEIEGMQRIEFFSKFDILFEYLDKYSLNSRKIISYHRFKRVYNNI